MSELAQSLAAGIAADTGRGEAGWIGELRARAEGHFRTSGLPAANVERWKYTSLRSLERRGLKLGTSASGHTGSTPEPLAKGLPCVLLHNGAFSALEGQLPYGVTVKPLTEALAEDQPGLRALLESLDTEAGSEGFAALNTATLGQGLLVHVSAGTDAGQLLLQWVGGADTDSDLFNSRVCVLLEAGARLELLEQFESGADRAPVLNVVTQCRLEAGARFSHARVQDESVAAALITRTDVHQCGGSHYHYSGLDLGGGLVRHDIRTRLAETDAECEINAACLASGRGHVDNHLDIEHLSPGCRSSQLFRGVLADRSRAVFNGRVLVAEGADGTEARQSSAGLLLSPHAEMDAKPELEIYADEVVASHGATVGQLDDEALFYLRSRGLDLETARNVLTMAFCGAVTDRVPAGPAREALAARLQSALEAGGLKNA